MNTLIIISIVFALLVIGIIVFVILKNKKKSQSNTTPDKCTYTENTWNDVCLNEIINKLLSEPDSPPKTEKYVKCLADGIKNNFKSPDDYNKANKNNVKEVITNIVNHCEPCKDGWTQDCVDSIKISLASKISPANDKTINCVANQLTQIPFDEIYQLKQEDFDKIGKICQVKIDPSIIY